MEQSVVASRPVGGLGGVARAWDAGNGANGLGSTAGTQRQGALAPWLLAHGAAVPKSPNTPSTPAATAGAQHLVAVEQAGSAKFNAINPELEA